MLAAGAFIFCCVLGAQGLAAQLLPRRQFLRVSSFLQLAAFGLFVTVYFLEPKLVAPGEIAVWQSHAYLAWSPTYWFLGLLQELNGSPALAPLAKRAWIGLAAAFGATAVAYSLSYLRTMRKIVEAPDIVSWSRKGSWLPSFGILSRRQWDSSVSGPCCAAASTVSWSPSIWGSASPLLSSSRDGR